MEKYDYKRSVDYYPSTDDIAKALVAIKLVRFPDSSYADIGLMMGTSRQHAHRLFTNGRVMTLQNWQILCNLFDMNLSAIFKIIENPSEKIPRRVPVERRIVLDQTHLHGYVLTLYQDITIKALHKYIRLILGINRNNIDYMVESPSIIAMSAYAVMAEQKLSVLLKNIEDKHGSE